MKAKLKSVLTKDNAIKVTGTIIACAIVVTVAIVAVRGGKALSNEFRNN